MRFDGRVMSATMTSYYRNDDCDKYPCEVRIDDETIVVSYDDENTINGTVVYRGKKVGCYRWKLECEELSGVATLSLSASDPNCLEGSWCEDRELGMWQIDVDDDD